MKKLFNVLLMALCFQKTCIAASVSYTSSGGRFGDELVAYTHARWVAYKYNIPLLFKSFQHSEKLKVSQMHKKLGNGSYTIVNFPRYTVRHGKVNLDAVIQPNENLLYNIPYFPESADELSRNQPWHFDVDWEDKGFIDILKKEIYPIQPVQKLLLPKDKISVAVHMRKGGGWHKDVLLQEAEKYDPKVSYADAAVPLKFVPFEYYVDQIIKISELLNNQPLYVHIFTDDKNPGALTRKCKAAVNKPNIHFASRENDNRHDANVLDDFFALTQFDCLIRGESNFSLMASKLADYKIQISPKNYVWKGTKLIITDVAIQTAVKAE